MCPQLAAMTVSLVVGDQLKVARTLDDHTGTIQEFKLNKPGRQPQMAWFQRRSLFDMQVRPLPTSIDNSGRDRQSSARPHKATILQEPFLGTAAGKQGRPICSRPCAASHKGSDGREYQYHCCRRPAPWRTPEPYCLPARASNTPLEKIKEIIIAWFHTEPKLQRIEKRSIVRQTFLPKQLVKHQQSDHLVRKFAVVGHRRGKQFAIMRLRFAVQKATQGCVDFITF